MTSTALPAPVVTGTGDVEVGKGQSPRRPSRAFVRLCIAAAGVTYLLIVAGGVVRVSGSGLGCGDTGADWPLCHGRLVPPADLATVIEFTHRCFAALSSALVLAVVLTACVRYRQHRRVVVAASVASVFFVAQILLGAITVELKLPGPVVMVHLANAEFLLATLIFIAVSVVRLRREPGAPRPARTAAAGRPARWAVAAAGGTYVLVLTGAFTVSESAGASCAGWPLCGTGFSLPTTSLGSVNVAHRVVAGTVALLVGYSMAQLMRGFRGNRAVRIVAMVVNVLLLAQIIAGALVVKLSLPAWSRGLHLALASALWAAVALGAMLTREQRGADLVAGTAEQARAVTA